MKKQELIDKIMKLRWDWNREKLSGEPIAVLEHILATITEANRHEKAYGG